MTQNQHHLVLGGARSGKSRFAEQRLEQSSNSLVYIATGQAGDAEMQERIKLHQAQRSERWQLIEAPLNLANAIQNLKPAQMVLIDCLTLWLSNCLHAKNWVAQREAFIQALQESTTSITMVSNEVGSGIVPMGELSREFVDESGRLHQELAGLCETVTLVVAGLALPIKHKSVEKAD
jgi:adenosylcobinamide kinase/adenosylcobinamide-phosphate guanylyltransferase